MRPTRGLPAATVLAFVVGACGSAVPPAPRGSVNLPNIVQIQGAIAQTIQRYDHVRAQVFCPSQVPEIVGETFSCVAIARRPAVRTFTYLVTVGHGSYVTYSQAG